MPRRQWARVVAVLAIGVVLVSCGAPLAQIPTPTVELITSAVVPLRVVCPESLVPAVQAAASAYQHESPATQVTVLSRTDTLALSALRQQAADIALLTYLSEPLPETAWARPISRDALAIVVNPQNGLPGLTMAQLRDLYQGRLEDWATWGGLPGPPQLVSREMSSGVAGYFQSWVMRDARVSLNALMAPSTEAVLSAVAEDPLAIGYISSVWVDGRVRAVAIEGVPPVAETVAAGLYPLTRTHFVVTMTEPDGPQREFVQWLLGAQGQSILQAHGLFSGQ